MKKNQTFSLPMHEENPPVNYFACILPLIMSLYFVVAGNTFSRPLEMNRWLLWSVLSFAGGVPQDNRLPLRPKEQVQRLRNS